MTTYTDSAFAPGMTSDTYNPDQLIAGDMKIVTNNVTILSGEGVLVRGTVLGKATVGAATAAAKSGGNTGNGTFVIDATTPTRPGAKVGVYTLRNIEAVANGGKFQLKDPDGISLGTFIIPAGAGASITIDDQIKGVLTDGGTDFVLTDGFDITVPAGSNKYRKAVSTNIDGSATPEAILVDDVDATSADKIVGAYKQGEFNANAITFGSGITLAIAREAFRTKGIFLKDTVKAADPS